MPSTLTIDASALSSYNSKTYLDEFFASLTLDSQSFYGGDPDNAYGSTYYLNGSQIVSTYDEGESASSSTVIMQGEDFAYDFIHNGAQYGHGISGDLDTLYFGEWTEDTSGTQGTGADGEVTGLDVGLVIDGWDIEADAGAGTDTSTNLTYYVYTALKNGDADALNDLIATYELEMIGSDGDDVMKGGDYDDVISGGLGDDRLLASAGDDIMTGGRGNDDIFGGKGNDTLAGGSGDDVLKGGGGKDELKGGSGNDTLVGGRGNDVLTGGDGEDTFVIVANSKKDVITDFDADEDVIDVTALGVTDLSDFTISETSDAVVLEAAGSIIVLEDYTETDLTADMFLF